MPLDLAEGKEMLLDLKTLKEGLLDKKFKALLSLINLPSKSDKR
jgi:hypothetical protein